MDFHNMIGKLRAIESLGERQEYVAEDAPESAMAGKCNMTAEGKSCPVHGMEECWSAPMEEGDAAALANMLKNSGQIAEADTMADYEANKAFTDMAKGAIDNADKAEDDATNAATAKSMGLTTIPRPQPRPTVASSTNTAFDAPVTPVGKPETITVTPLNNNPANTTKYGIPNYDQNLADVKARRAKTAYAPADTSGGVTSDPTYMPKTAYPLAVGGARPAGPAAGMPAAPKTAIPAPTSYVPEPATFKDAFRAARKAAGGASGVFMWKGKPYQTNVKGEPAKAWNSPDLKKVGSGWPTSESVGRRMKTTRVNEAGGIGGGISGGKFGMKLPATKGVTRDSTYMPKTAYPPADTSGGVTRDSTYMPKTAYPPADTSGGVTSDPTYMPKTAYPPAVGGARPAGPAAGMPAAPKTAIPAPSSSVPAPTSFKDAFRAARKAAGGAGGVFMWKGKPYQTNVKGEQAKPWNSPDLKKVGNGWPTSESTGRKMKSATVAEAKINENFLGNLVGDIRNAFKPGIAITPNLVKDMEAAVAKVKAGQPVSAREQKMLDNLMSTTLARELNKILKTAPKELNIPTLESAKHKKKSVRINEAGGIGGGISGGTFGRSNLTGIASKLAKLRFGTASDARELKYEIIGLSNEELDQAAKTWGKDWPEIAKEVARRDDIMKDIMKPLRGVSASTANDVYPTFSKFEKKLPIADAEKVAKLIKSPVMMPIIKKVLWRAIPGLGAYLQGRDALDQVKNGNWRNAFVDLGIAGVNVAQVFGYLAAGAPGVAATIADIAGNLYVNRGDIVKLYYGDVLGMDLSDFTDADLEYVADGLIQEIAKQLATQISNGITGALGLNKDNSVMTRSNGRTQQSVGEQISTLAGVRQHNSVVKDNNSMDESVNRMRELAGLSEMTGDSDDQAKVDDMAADMSADAVDEMVKHDDDSTHGMTIEDLMRKYGVEDEVNEDAPLVGMPFTSLGATNNGPEEWGMVVTGGTNTNNFNESKQLKEGFTINSNMVVTDGKATKSLTINATDDDVDTLATMLRNAGMGSRMDVNNHSNVCDDCGMPEDRCTCGMNQTAMCDACDRPLEDCTCGDESDDCGCGSESCTCGMTMENADHDYGHDEKSEIGEPLDVEEYVWDGPHLNQRFGKIGDNTLMAERAITLFKNYSDQYTQMLEEADLDPSNAGFDSPLTANSRDEFDKDPFVDETPVDDGSRSPLSTVKRQDVMEQIRKLAKILETTQTLYRIKVLSEAVTKQDADALSQAISNFQSKAGIPVTGVLDADTTSQLDAALNSAEPAYNNNDEPADSSLADENSAALDAQIAKRNAQKAYQSALNAPNQSAARQAQNDIYANQMSDPESMGWTYAEPDTDDAGNPEMTTFPSMGAANAKVNYYQPGEEAMIAGQLYVRDVNDQNNKVWVPAN